MNKDYLVQQRRRLEDNRAMYMATSAADRQQRIAANWEVKSTLRAQAATRERAIREMRQDRARTLSSRRSRLSSLLSEEQQSLTYELNQLKETPAARRAAIRAEAEAVRSARREREAAKARDLLEQAWRNGSDELRTVTSKAMTKATAMGRRGQMEERDDGDREREEVYRVMAEEAVVEARKKDEYERVVREGKKEELRSELDRLVNEKKWRAERESEASREEYAQMKEEWSKMDEKDKEDAIRQAERKAALRKLIAMEKRKRDVILREEEERRLEEEREIVASVKADVAEDARRMQEKKRQTKDESMLYRQLLEEQRVVATADEGAEQKMREEEEEEQWRKREGVWNRESEARGRLMDDVKRVREEQMGEKIAARVDADEWKRKERVMLDEDITHYKDVEAEMWLQRRKENQRVAGIHKEQAAWKDRKRREEMERELAAAALERKRREEYEARVEHERLRLERGLW